MIKIIMRSEFDSILLVDTAVYLAPDTIYLLPGAFHHKNKKNRYKDEENAIFHERLPLFAPQNSK